MNKTVLQIADALERIDPVLTTPRTSARADRLLLSLLMSLLALYVALTWFVDHHRDQTAKPGKADPTVEWWVEAPLLQKP